IKEAVTDALKRTLRTFGNPFGLALYDKSRANVGHAEEEAQAVSKKDARPIYDSLVKDMRRCPSKDDLRRWITDPDVKELRQKLPADWDQKLREEAAEHGRSLDVPPSVNGDAYRAAKDGKPAALNTLMGG